MHALFPLLLEIWIIDVEYCVQAKKKNYEPNERNEKDKKAMNREK